MNFDREKIYREHEEASAKFAEEIDDTTYEGQVQKYLYTRPIGEIPGVEQMDPFLAQSTRNSLFTYARLEEMRLLNHAMFNMRPDPEDQPLNNSLRSVLDQPSMLLRKSLVDIGQQAHLDEIDKIVNSFYTLR